jgi:hypothetical protein
LTSQTPAKTSDTPYLVVCELSYQSWLVLLSASLAAQGNAGVVVAAVDDVRLHLRVQVDRRLRQLRSRRRFRNRNRGSRQKSEE